MNRRTTNRGLSDLSRYRCRSGRYGASIQSWRARRLAVARASITQGQTPVASASSVLSKLSPSPALAFPALTIPSFDILTPLSTLFLTHPLPTYTSSIIILTLLTRTLVTLPVTIWSRAHLARLRTIVGPILKRKNESLALRLVPECRKLGLSHKEYVEVLKGEIKKTRKETLKEYGVRPRLTAFLPPLIHLPLFVGLSLTIREATRLATELNTVDIAARNPDVELPLEQNVNPDNSGAGLDNAAAILANTPDMTSHLAAFLNEHPFHLASLIDPDASMILPFIVGIAMFSNVELMQTWRDTSRGLAADAKEAGVPADRGKTGKIIADPTRKSARPRRSVLEDVPVNGEGKAGAEAQKREEAVTISSRIIGFALRGLAVASVGFAAEAPAVSGCPGSSLCLPCRPSVRVLKMITFPGGSHLLDDLDGLHLGAELHLIASREEGEASFCRSETTPGASTCSSGNSNTNICKHFTKASGKETIDLSSRFV